MTKKVIEVYRFGRVTKKGIFPKNPNSTFTLAEHVRKGSNITEGTRFISCSYTMSGVISYLLGMIDSTHHNRKEKTLAEILVEKQSRRNDGSVGARVSLIEDIYCNGVWHDSFNENCLDSKGSNWVQDQEEITLEGYIPSSAIIDKGLLLVREGNFYVWWRGENSNYKEPISLSINVATKAAKLHKWGLLGESPLIKGEPSV